MTDDMTPTPTRCPAAHPDDQTSCDGPVAVTILDANNDGADGCTHHGARLLASLEGGRVYALPEAAPGSAIRVFKWADTIRPFPWVDAPRYRDEQLSRAEVRERTRTEETSLAGARERVAGLASVVKVTTEATAVEVRVRDLVEQLAELGQEVAAGETDQAHALADVVDELVALTPPAPPSLYPPMPPLPGRPAALAELEDRVREAGGFLVLPAGEARPGIGEQQVTSVGLATIPARLPAGPDDMVLVFKPWPGLGRCLYALAHGLTVTELLVEVEAHTLGRKTLGPPSTPSPSRRSSTPPPPGGRAR